MGSGQRPSTGDRVLRIGVITASDTRTAETDGSGQWLRQRLDEAGHEVVDYRITEDDSGAIEAAIDQQLRLGVDAILVTGGTGISPRDQSPEALQSVCSRLLPGFGELFRQLSYQEIGTKAMASRALAGVRDTTVLFALPGSTAACRLGLERLILPELPHLAAMVQGADHDPPG